MKRTFSILLAFVMLLSIVPMTALTTAAAITDEVVETGETYGVSTGEALLAMLEKDTPSGDVMTINVNADINYYVTTEGESGLSSYLRYACTLGKGKKILNLNGHAVHFYNDYSVIQAYSGSDSATLNHYNTQCLLEIPTGADLTVNGDASGRVDSGLLQYHGKLLYKCDAVDQRDLFEIRGGSLTINSGRFLAGGESTSYEWSVSMDILPGIYVPSSRKAWYLVSGTAIRALSGELTVNGGFFEGRGLKGYSFNRNSALYADSSMRSVVINDGHFKGRSAANVLDVENAENAGKLTVNAGLFELEHSDAVIGVIYHSYDCATSDPGVQGLYFREPNPNTVYYYKEKSNSSFIEASQSSLKSDELAFFRHSTAFQVYVDPKQGHRVDSGMSIDPTSELKFLVKGKQYSESDKACWHPGDPFRVYIDPASLYFKDQQMSSYGVEQSMSPTVRFDIIHIFDDGDSPTIFEDQSAALSKSSEGGYYLDLNSLSSTIKNKLYGNETYCFRITATENWKSRREFNIWHTGSFNVTITRNVRQLYCRIDEPVYGAKPSTNVYYSSYQDWCEITLGSWTYKSSESDSWHTMGESDYFRRDMIYSANFIVNMKSGFSLADDAEFFVGDEEAEIYYQNSGGLIAGAIFDLRAEPIRSIIINDVPAPVSGEKPIYSFDYPAGYYTTDEWYMDWYDEYGFKMNKNDIFEGGKEYTVQFHVMTTDGYQFDENVGAMINGYKANVTEKWTDVTNTGHARVEYTFTCPISVEIIRELDVTVSGIKVGDELPYTASVPEGFGYAVEDYNQDAVYWKNGVMWSDESGAHLPFGTKLEAGKTYRVEVSLVLTDSERYQFLDPAEEVSGYLNEQEAEVLEYSESNYSVRYTFTVPAAAGGLVGDVNADSAVNNRDAMILDRYVAGWEGYAANIKNMDAADMNRDTAVNNRDAMILDRYVAGWEGYDKYIIVIAS